MIENLQGEHDAESGFVGAPDIPSQLPLLPMRTVGLFPGISGPLSVGREASVRVIEDAFAGEKLIGLMTQRDPTEDKPRPAGLYNVGVAARLHRIQRVPDGTLRVLAQGLQTHPRIGLSPGRALFSRAYPDPPRCGRALERGGEFASLPRVAVQQAHGADAAHGW